MSRLWGPTGRISRAIRLSELNLQISSTSIPVVISSASTTIQDTRDQRETIYETATYYNNYDVHVTVLADQYRLSDESVITNLTPSIASWDGSRLTRITNGIARVQLTTSWVKQILEVDMSIVNGQQTSTFSLVPGSLADHCTNAILTRLSGTTFPQAQPLYSSQNHSTATFIRNPNFWGADLDLTCISPSNSYSNALRAGVSISPRHILFAKHYPIPVGTTIRFVTSDNVTVTRTLTAVQSISGDLFTGDITVGLLDSDLPNTISFAKVMPSNALDYLTWMNKVLAWGTNRLEDSTIRGCSGIGFDRGDYQETQEYYYNPLVSGDSGSPFFFIINNELVVLQLMTWSWGSGTMIWDRLDSINQAMTTLGGGYQLTQVNLSGFPNYA